MKKVSIQGRWAAATVIAVNTKGGDVARYRKQMIGWLVSPDQEQLDGLVHLGPLELLKILHIIGNLGSMTVVRPIKRVEIRSLGHKADRWKCVLAIQLKYQIATSNGAPAPLNI